MAHKEIIRNLVVKVLEYKKEIESLGLDVTQLTHIPQLQPHLNETEPRFQVAKDLQDEIIEEIQSNNPGMLTRQVIVSNVLYQTITVLIASNADEEETNRNIQEVVTNLLEYKSFRKIDIPIVLLKVSKPYVFGPVTFHPFTSEDTKSEWGKKIINSVDQFFISSMCYASVLAPGDHYQAISYSYNLVSDSLNIIKGLGIPIVAEYTNQIAIMDSKPSTGNMYFRISRPDEDIKIDPYYGITTQVDGPIYTYRLYEDILSNVDEKHLQVVEEIVSSKNNFSPSNKIHSKILQGLRWLGESTRNDILQSRYAKLAFSLEAMIGGEATGDHFTRGIVATLAERAAFLAGMNLEERLDIDKNIRKYYGKRSAIVHGSVSTIYPNDFEKFAELVRKVCWGLIENCGSFNNVNELNAWIREQAYSD